jgi:hypothetical protein
LNNYYVRSYVINEHDEEHCDLEDHHTHFFLFDDEELTNDPSVVLSQRAHIEKCLKTLDLESNEIIPIVMILVEGGSASIKTICQALQENTPVLVIKVTLF